MGRVKQAVEARARRVGSRLPRVGVQKGGILASVSKVASSISLRAWSTPRLSRRLVLRQRRHDLLGALLTQVCVLMGARRAADARGGMYHADLGVLSSSGRRPWRASAGLKRKIVAVSRKNQRLVLANSTIGWRWHQWQVRGEGSHESGQVRSRHVPGLAGHMEGRVWCLVFVHRYGRNLDRNCRGRRVSAKTATMCARDSPRRTHI